VDTRRLEDGFGPIDFFELATCPFVVAITPSTACSAPARGRRDALRSGRTSRPGLDARERDSAKRGLISGWSISKTHIK